MLASTIFWLFMARHRKPAKFKPVYHSICSDSEAAK